MLLRSPDGLKRQLTAEGVEYVRTKLAIFGHAFGSPSANPPTRRRNQRVLNELRDNPLTQAFLSGQQPELTRIAVADLLMCSPDSPASEWLRHCKSLEAGSAGGRMRISLVSWDIDPKDCGVVWGDEGMTRRAGQEGRVEYTYWAFSQERSNKL